MALVAKVEILGEFKNLTKATRGATDEMSKMNRKFAGFSRGIQTSLGLIAGSLVFRELGEGIRTAISAASDFVEAGSAVEEVFGDASDTIYKFAETAADTIGQSKNSALDAAKTFGIYGNAAGLAADDSAKFSTDLLTLASDLASFNNTSVDDALSALGSGLRGEAEPLRRYGIMLNDAKLKSAAMELGIYDGNGALTDQQKILAANEVIFDESGTAQGNFALTADGLANSTRTATANIEDLQTEIGIALLPVMDDLVAVFRDELLPKLEDFADWLNSPKGTAFIDGVADTIGSIVDGLTFLGSIPGFLEDTGAKTQDYLNTAEKTHTVDPRQYIGTSPGGVPLSSMLPGVPQMADGGVVLPRAGGQLVNVGEAGQAEAIVPLDRLGNLGGSNQYIININKANVSGKEVVDAIRRYETSNGRRVIN